MAIFRYSMLSFFLTIIYAAIGMNCFTRNSFFSAIENNSIQQIQKAYEQGLVDINALDNRGQSALDYAVFLNKHALVTWMLEQPNVSLDIKLKAFHTSLSLCLKDSRNPIARDILTLLADTIIDYLAQDHIYDLLVAVADIASNATSLFEEFKQRGISVISPQIITIYEDIFVKLLKNIDLSNSLRHTTKKQELLTDTLAVCVNPKLLLLLCKHLAINKNDLQAALRKLPQRIDIYNEGLFEEHLKNAYSDPYAGLGALDTINLRSLKRNRMIRALRRCLVTHMVLSKKLPTDIAWDIALQTLQVDNTCYNYTSLFEAALKRDDNNNNNTQAARSWCIVQ